MGKVTFISIYDGISKLSVNEFSSISTATVIIFVIHLLFQPPGIDISFYINLSIYDPDLYKLNKVIHKYMYIDIYSVRSYAFLNLS